MLNRLLHLGLWAVFAITLAIMLINALYMLVSPKAWFALPGWLRLEGVMTMNRYGDRWGTLQIRVLGAVVIAAIGWIAIGLLTAVGKR